MGSDRLNNSTKEIDVLFQTEKIVLSQAAKRRKHYRIACFCFATILAISFVSSPPLLRLVELPVSALAWLELLVTFTDIKSRNLDIVIEFIGELEGKEISGIDADRLLREKLETLNIK